MAARGEQIDARFVLERAIERARTLLREIDRLGAKEYAFPLPATLLGVARTFAVDAEKALVALRDDPVMWHMGTPTSERLDSIQTRTADVTWIHKLLLFLDKVDSSRLPFEAVRAFEQHATDLLKCKRVRLLLQPIRKHKYSVLDLQAALKKRGGRWASAAESVADCFVLSFPSADSGSVLLQMLFLHELGHPFYQRTLSKILEPHLVAALRDTELTFDAQIKAQIQLQLAAIGLMPGEQSGNQQQFSDARSQQLRNLIVNEAAEIARAWVEEITCDFFAMRQSGPAYLCSFAAFILPFLSTNIPSKTHPDIGLRVALLEFYANDQAAKSAFFNALRSDYFKMDPQLSGTPSASASLQLKMAGHVLRCTDDNPLLKAMLDLVNESTPSALDLSGFEEAAKTAVSGLNDLVPPDPALYFKTLPSSGAMIAFVFEVSWLFKVNGFGDWKTRYGWESEKSDEILNQLALKALEAGELQRRYPRREA